MGPPAICVVFEVPDEDEAQLEDINAQKEELLMVLFLIFRKDNSPEQLTSLYYWQVVGRLRSLNLTVEKYDSSDKKFLFLKVSGNDAMLKYEAEEKKFRCKLKSDFGGAQCGYSYVGVLVLFFLYDFLLDTRHL